MASQVQLLIALLILVGIVLIAGVAVQSGVSAVPRFAGSGGTQAGTLTGAAAEAAAPITVVNVYPTAP